MMKVLIVEDDRNKETALREVVQTELPCAAIIQKRSYQSGLDEALRERPDLIVLDMSLPNYDVSPTEGGFKFLYFAGRDILRELKRKRVPSRVVVVTQFATFGEGRELTTLTELTASLELQFPDNYVKTIYYHPAQTDWRGDLVATIRAVGSTQ